MGWGEAPSNNPVPVVNLSNESLTLGILTGSAGWKTAADP